MGIIIRISPLLANLFLHDAFDQWMVCELPEIPLERYADNIICHNRKMKDTLKGREAIRKRLGAVGLKVNEAKSKIVNVDTFER